VGLLFFILVGVVGIYSRMPRQLHPGFSKKCPRCAEQVKLEALTCRFCGSEFPPEMIPLDAKAP
jgi:hypothetical protein